MNFVTWRWPTVAETCRRQHNKWDTKTIVFWRTYPLLICTKHNGDDAPKAFSDSSPLRIPSRVKFWHVSVVPQCSTPSDDLLPISVLWFCPAYWFRVETRRYSNVIWVMTASFHVLSNLLVILTIRLFLQCTDASCRLYIRQCKTILISVHDRNIMLLHKILEFLRKHFTRDLKQRYEILIDRPMKNLWNINVWKADE